MDFFQDRDERGPDVVLVVSEGGVIQEANRNISGVLGYNTGGLEDVSVDDLLLAREDESQIKVQQRELINLETCSIENLYALRKDGVKIPVQVSLDPIELAGDSYVIMGITDLTERKEREQALQARSAAMDASIDGMAILNTDGEYTFVNQAHADVYEYEEPNAFLGESWRMCYDEAEINRFESTVMSALSENGSWRGEAVGLREDGSTFPQELSLAMTDDERIICVVRDITERKQREQELESQNKRLEKFARTISHDLRNPLNVAAGQVELAREDCDSDSLAAAMRALERSETLIDELLTLARQGEQVGDIESVSLATTVGRCWQNVATADATLVMNTEQTIRADPTRLAQLFENLIRNAIEHGDEEASVTVGELEDGFYVADGGPGIPPADRELVFESGYSTAANGTGFGLSIVSEIADAHGWDVTVTESEAGGARFEITGVESTGN